MNMEKIKTFVKSHKTELLVIAGGVGVVAGVALLAVGVKPNFLKKKLSVPKIEDISVPKDFMVGTVTELWKEKGCVNAIVNDLTTADLGRIGAEFVDKGIVADGAEVSMIVGFLNK